MFKRIIQQKYWNCCGKNIFCSWEFYHQMSIQDYKCFMKNYDYMGLGIIIWLQKFYIKLFLISVFFPSNKEENNEKN